jgi:aarF domain-containing kinase
MAVPTEALLHAAAELPLASARCPGTFVIEFKDTKQVWVLRLTKDAPSASLLPAGNPAPPADCHLTYKSEAVFTSLHLTKDADPKSLFLKGAVGIKGDVKRLGSLQGLLDEARVRHQLARTSASLVTTTASSGLTPNGVGAAAQTEHRTPPPLHIQVLCSQVVRDSGDTVFADLREKRHVEYVIGCSPIPFPATSPPAPAPRILGDRTTIPQPPRRHLLSVPDEGWTVRQRFSAFVDLHRRLMRLGEVRHKLPPKTMFGSPSLKVVKEREARLGSYLTGVLTGASPAQRLALDEFLAPRVTGPSAVGALSPPAVTSTAGSVAVPSDAAEGVEETDSEATEASEALEAARAELRSLEDRSREFQRQSFNGFGLVLLATARIIHIMFALTCAITGIRLFYGVAHLLLLLTYLGRSEDGACPTPLSPLLFLFSAAYDALTPLLPSPADVIEWPHLTQFFATVSELWGSLWPTLCPIRRNLWPLSVLLGLPSAAAVYWRFRRRMLVFVTAGMVITLLKLVRIHAERLSASDSEDLWEFVLRVVGLFIYRSILRLKGIWIKAGQYIGSRSDVMPQAIIDEFVKLQDAVPPSPFEGVKHTVEAALKGTLADLFAEFQEDALAAASIAQVHIARLKDGRKVVVKVQHEGVRELMLEDLWSLWVIVRFVAWAEPQYDFRPIMEEWIKHVEMELDFTWEVRSLKRAHEAMAKSGLDVVIPVPVEAFTATRVCVMEFCDGLKVTDAKSLAQIPDREGAMKLICQSFAYQMHIDGLFNADPHPGNILLQTTVSPSGQSVTRPVLLDWGLAKILDDDRRLAFAAFVFAAFERDFVGMLEAFRLIGIKLNREDPMTDLSNIRFLFRDTAPPEDAREVFKDQSKKWKEQREKFRKANPGRKSPVDAFPGDLLFFMRVTNLMHGLGARFQVRTPYLAIMAPFARQALLERYPPLSSVIYASSLLSPLEQSIRELLTSFHERGQLVGCQVCVYHEGRKVVDIASGTRGPVDRRPCTPDMVFGGSKLSAVALAVAVHLAADRGLLGYDDPVAKTWAKFGAAGKEGITVRQLLTHQARLQHAIPDSLSMEVLMDRKAMLKSIENTKPLTGASGRCIYHPFWPWLLAGLLEHATGSPAGEFFREKVAAALDVEGEMFLGLPAEFPTERVAELSYQLPTELGGGGGGARDGIGEMLGIGERPQNPDDIFADDDEEGTVMRAVMAKLHGRQYLLDPRLANHPHLRQSLTSGYSSARALAKCLDALPYVLSPGRMDLITAFQGTDDSLPQHLFGDGRPAHWGLGFQIFRFKGPFGDGAAGPAAIGHWGGGGSLVFSVPSHRLSFSMVVNKLSRDTSPTEAVAQLVCQKFGLGDPFAD